MTFFIFLVGGFQFDVHVLLLLHFYEWQNSWRKEIVTNRKSFAVLVGFIFHFRVKSSFNLLRMRIANNNNKISIESSLSFLFVILRGHILKVALLAIHLSVFWYLTYLSFVRWQHLQQTWQHRQLSNHLKFVHVNVWRVNKFFIIKSVPVKSRYFN